MKKIYALTIIFFLSITSVFSQTIINIEIFTDEDTKGEKKPDEPESKVTTIDTLYCTTTKKQNGWFAPLDTISKEVVDHRSFSFRFTNKNEAGKWCKLECIDGYGNYVKGRMSPYILKMGSSDTDKDANQEWIEKLSTACIYEFIADYSGEVIVQERAYDENMNLIYTYSRVPVGKKQYVGSYKDIHGLPVEMRNGDGYTFGTLVKITEDKYGNDSIVQYIDAKGLSKLNSDSVAMEVYIHDEYGRLIKQQSCNADGSLAIDNWGNCGVEYKWNDKYEIISATCMDDKWQPMRMPGKRDNTGSENVIRTNYIYGDYKRQDAEYYTDNEGNLDVNKLGTHKIVNTFNGRGNCIKRHGYNKNNELSPIDLSGAAIEEYEFNDKGKILAARFYDKDSIPISTEGYWCRIKWEYDDNGNETSVKRYSIINGEEKLTLTEQQNSNYIYTLGIDGTSRVDSLDNKGRTTFVGFYDANDSLEMIGGRAYEKSEYIEDGHNTIIIETNYDNNGNRTEIDGVYKTVRTIDSLKCTEIRMRYDVQDILKESFIHQYDKGFNKIVAQYDANSFGVLTRSGGVSDVRCYIVRIIYNKKDEFAALVGRDEFNEPDYITSNHGTYYYQKLYPNSEPKFFDENNREIEDEKELRDTLPKVMTIEVVDSIAYSHGLRDNDVILLYGDYAVNLDDIPSYNQFRRDWVLRTILDARKNKRMVVFRIEDASKNQYGLVEIDNLEGTPSELGFLAHIRYLTKKQTKRIQDAIDANIVSNNPIVSESDFLKKEPGGGHYVIMAFTEMYRSYRDKPYAKQITDPAILIGACIKDKNMYWNLNDGYDTRDFESMLDTRSRESFRYPPMDYYLTTDMTTVSHLLLEEKYPWTSWFHTWISDEDYAVLLDLYEGVMKEIEENNKKAPQYRKKDLVASWVISQDSNAEYPITGSLHLAKNGESMGSIITYGKISFTDGDALFKIETDYSGSWNYYGGDIITFSPNKEDNITLSCVDLIGADEELKESAVAYMNSICEENKSNLLELMSFINAPLGNDWFIKSFNKKVLLLDDGSDEGTSFVKTKNTYKKPKRQDDPKSSSKKKKTKTKNTNSNSPIIGEWAATIPELNDAHMIFKFAEDKTFSCGIIIDVSVPIEDAIVANLSWAITIGGDWEVEADTLTAKLDAGRMKMDSDVKVEGANAKTQKEIEEYYKKYFEHFALEFLNKFNSESSKPFSISSDQLTINGITLDRFKSAVLAIVEGDEGYFIEQGYSGMFVVLECCEWDCTQSLEAFSEESEKRKDTKKNIVLLPVEVNNGVDVFKDIIRVECPDGKLGLRVKDITLSWSYYQENILNRYQEWKSQY